MKSILAIIALAFSQFMLYSSEYQVNDSVKLKSDINWELYKTAKTDTLPKPSFKKAMADITSSKMFRMTYSSIPLIVSGLIIQGEDNHFKSFRNEYAKQYNTHYDDILQYSPAAAMLIMKACGVNGRSSWSRMLVSDAFSVALMAGATNLIKRTVNEMRPDGSNTNSFPSGHTATAFMCATMLHKEYGHISPWISVGGYAVATATGVSRILNNKHWMSDVLVGAGIGILSTELGYFLADLIFKKNGLNEFQLAAPYGRWHKPSFLGLRLGFNLSCASYDIPNYGRVKLDTGANAGIEGAYFFNPYIGVGGNLSLSNMPVILNESYQPNDLMIGSMYAGAYFSYPLCSQFHISAKMMGGVNRYEKCELPNISIGGVVGAGMETGASIVFMASKAFNARLFCDYNLTKSFIKGLDKSTQYVTIGSTAAINF